MGSNYTSKIAGVGTFCPERKVDNAFLLEKLERDNASSLSKEDRTQLINIAEFALDRMGAKTRYWAADDEYCTDLGRNASKMALEDAGISPNELDLVIFTGVTHAFVEPASAHVIREDLNALNADVIDTQDACASFVKSLDIADCMIRAGRYKKILIATGESGCSLWSYEFKSLEEAKYKLGLLTMGNVGGAVVVEATQEEEYLNFPYHMVFSYLYEGNGSYAHSNIGFHHSAGKLCELHVDAKILYPTAMKLFVKFFQETEWMNLSFDNLFVHDVGRIIEELLPRFRRKETKEGVLPDNYKSFFPESGNIGPASLPMSMDMAKNDGRLKRGNRVLFVGGASGIQVCATTFLY